MTCLFVVCCCCFLAIGSVPSPFDCYLANLGLKTLHLRMRQHQASATAVAEFLEKNSGVEKVFYPGELVKVNTKDNKSLEHHYKKMSAV